MRAILSGPLTPRPEPYKSFTDGPTRLDGVGLSPPCSEHYQELLGQLENTSR